MLAVLAVGSKDVYIHDRSVIFANFESTCRQELHFFQLFHQYFIEGLKYLDLYMLRVITVLSAILVF